MEADETPAGEQREASSFWSALPGGSAARFLIISLIPLCGAGIVAYLGGTFEYNFSAFAISLLLLFYTPIPVAVYIILFWKERNRYLAAIRSIVILWAMLLVLLIPALFLGDVLLERRREQVKRTGKELAAKIESYFEKHNHYPASLEALVKEGFDVESLSAKFYSYWVDENGSSFHLGFSGPRFLELWMYDPDNGEWFRVD